MTPWRLFLDKNHSGAHNMAVDEAILLAHARDFAPPTLRFYGWNPFCLSLGRLQKQLPDSVLAKEDSEVAEAESSGDETVRGAPNFDLVRRPTGGRAVWHAREITYCAVVRAELLPPDARGVQGAYRWLSEGFLRGLRSLGIPVEMAPGEGKANDSNCFAASASCDFVANGRKLIGAAQCRADGAILQHGSLLLSIDASDWRFAGGPMNSATSLREFGDFSQDSVIAALCEGFAASAGIRWEITGLGNREIALSQILNERKYSRRTWTFGAKIADPDREVIDLALRM